MTLKDRIAALSDEQMEALEFQLGAMALRDKFAIAALPAVIAMGNKNLPDFERNASDIAYRFADAMLRARKREAK